MDRTTKIGKLSISHSGRRTLQGGAMVETLRECYTQLDRPQAVLVNTGRSHFNRKHERFALHLGPASYIKLPSTPRWITGKPSTHKGRRHFSKAEALPLDLARSQLLLAHDWLPGVRFFRPAVRHPLGARALDVGPVIPSPKEHPEVCWHKSWPRRLRKDIHHLVWWCLMFSPAIRL